MIRTVRQVLRTTLKQQLVSDEVLSTFMAEAVYIINSRPLTRNSDDHGDEMLTLIAYNVVVVSD